MENYEQKYKKALSFLKDLKHYMSDYCIEKLEGFFPELKESEDERMIRIIENAICTSEAQQLVKTKYGLELTDLADWLEKQGEQKNEEMPALVCPKCMKSFEKCEDYSVYHDRIRYICPHCGYDGDSVEFETSYKNHPIHNVTPLMIQWKGNNLKQVIEFTGKSPKFNEWFKSFEEYETYVREHNNIFKLFNEDGSNYEVPVGAWIVKTPDGYNVASKAIFKWISNWNEEDEEMFDAIIADIQFTQKAHNHEVNQVVYEREIDWLKSLKDRVQPQPKQEWSEKDKHILKNIHDFVKENTIDSNRVNCAEECLNWLKSLKPQTHWKPSEEQMKALIIAVHNAHGHSYHKGIYSLLNDLKKL